MKVLITGGHGFLGEILSRQLSIGHNVLSLGSSHGDLRTHGALDKYLNEFKPDVVVALAARLGGIGDNINHPSEYFLDNLQIGVNTLNSFKNYSLSLNKNARIILIGTVCSYPKSPPLPFKELDFWNGYPEETNGPYGIAKKAVSEYSFCLSRQFGVKCVNLLLTNLYGPKDDFRPETSHVIPALIRKVHHAKLNDLTSIDVWGRGDTSRDFLYVHDASQVIKHFVEKYFGPNNYFNIGTGVEITLENLVSVICSKMEFNGAIKWNNKRPSGQPRRVLDNSRLRTEFDINFTSFDDGLAATISYYIDNQNEIHAQGPKFGV